MSDREIGGKHSSQQECDDDIKTTRSSSHGSLQTRCLHQHQGSKYGLVIVDDFSRFTWVFFLQDKSETQGTLKRFLRRAQNEFELKVKKIRSDNGSGFKNLQVEEYLEEEGIKHKFSAPYTPQQNGVVERKNRTLIDMARTMLGEYKTPERFWSEAVNTACHAINRLYLHRLLKKTSYDSLQVTNPMFLIFVYLGANATFW
jgi:transposase InsO family protein